jgi:hypothetical protein
LDQGFYSGNEKTWKQTPTGPLKKVLRTLFGRLSLVDKRIEISNLDLTRDMVNSMNLANKKING